MSVENLNSFIVDRLVKADRGFDVFLVADAEQVSTPEFIRRLAKAAGTTSRLLPLPTVLDSRHRKCKESNGLTGSFEDRSWARKAII